MDRSGDFLLIMEVTHRHQWVTAKLSPAISVRDTLHKCNEGEP